MMVDINYDILSVAFPVPILDALHINKFLAGERR